MAVIPGPSDYDVHTYTPTSVTLEAGWETQAHGPALWLDAPDEDAAYLEGTSFFVFRVDWDDVPAGDLALDIQAWVNGYAILRVSRTYENTAGPEVFEVASDVDLYSYSEWAQPGWARTIAGSGLGQHAGGALTLWFRTTAHSGLWEQRLSFVGVAQNGPAPILRVPPRRIFPRDDGMTGGGAPRTYPPSKGLQSGIRTSGGYL